VAVLCAIGLTIYFIRHRNPPVVTASGNDLVETETENN
jgi:hypothetical protein